MEGDGGGLRMYGIGTWEIKVISSWSQKMKTQRRKNIEGENKKFVPKLFWLVTFKMWNRFWYGKMLEICARRAETICEIYIFQQDCLRDWTRMFCDKLYNFAFFQIFLRPFLSEVLFGTVHVFQHGFYLREILWLFENIS